MSSLSISPGGVILVADATPLLRCGLRHTLAATFTTYEILEANTFPELLALAASQPASLLVVAPDLPGAPPEPATVLQSLRTGQPQVAVIMLVDPQLTPELSILRLLRQNVNGLLLRTTPLAEVCETVATVLQRGRCYSEHALTLLHSHLQQGRKPEKTAVLSPRQLQVLQLITKDLSNEEIAEYLCTSVRTVEYHRSQMLQKTGTRTTLGLVLFALRHNLLAAGALLPATQSVGPEGCGSPSYQPQNQRTSASTKAMPARHL